MRSASARSRPIPILVYACIATAALLLLPWIGAEAVGWRDIARHFSGDQSAATHAAILFNHRIPRIILAMLVGGALATAGCALQVLFRNPLAEPWTLGVSGGAAIGVFFAQAFPALQIGIGPLNTTQALALAGATVVLLLIYGFARRNSRVAPHTLLLAGVTIGIVSGGIMTLMTYFTSPFKFVSFHRWMLGGLDVVGYRDILTFAMLGIPGLIILAARARDYNHLALGEDTAAGQGVDVRKLQNATFFGAGLTTAACVAVAGPIAFVGLIIPHVVRGLSGYDHRRIMPAAFLLGGAALALCDTIARTVIAPTEIPVGAVTAVIGGPLFVILLMRR